MSKFFQALGTVEAAEAGLQLPFTDEELADARKESEPIPDSEPEFIPEDAAPKIPPVRKASRPEPYAGVPIVCRTVSVRIAADAPVLPYDSTNQSAAERYRIIRTRLVQHPSKPKVLCISSASMGDGKTVTAVNLAASLALKKDTTSLLVDVDFRRGRVASMLGVENRPGLADVLAGTCPIEDAVIRIAELPSLYFLPAGSGPANTTELLDSQRWRDLLATFRNTYTFTLLDSPPVGIVADYDLLQASADGLILVARPEHTNRTLLQSAVEVVPKDKLLGLIVNCETDWFLWRSTASYSGHYDYVRNGAQ